jgi:hypothetical protein
MQDQLTVFGLRLLGGVFVLIALVGVAAPTLLFDPLGVSLSTPSGLAEIRAAYGAMFSATATFFFYSAAQPARHALALLGATWILGGFLVGRAISLGLDGVPNTMAIANTAVEGLGFVLAFRLWRRCTTSSTEPAA